MALFNLAKVKLYSQIDFMCTLPLKPPGSSILLCLVNFLITLYAHISNTRRQTELTWQSERDASCDEVAAPVDETWQP